MKEAVKGIAVPRTELGEGGTEAAREKFLLIRHRRRRGVKDLVGRAGGDRSGDRLRLQGLEGGFVLLLLLPMKSSRFPAQEVEVRASRGGGSGGGGGAGGSGGISGSPSNADISERKVATWSGLRQRSSVVSCVG